MPDRRKLVVANWKMNGLNRDARDLVARIALNKHDLRHVVLCPPHTLLSPVGKALEATRMHLGGQDCHHEQAGAFTGDVSARMLKDNGCAYVILGHSERRAYHQETDEQVKHKAEAAHAEGLKTIICVGETAAQREQGRERAVVEAQLRGSLPPCAHAKNTIIAYEPVWAIGTGNTATRKDIADMHDFITVFMLRYRPDWNGEAKALYGGSVKAANAEEILSVPSVGGVLVGGASLDYREFEGIIDATALERCWFPLRAV